MNQHSRSACRRLQAAAVFHLSPSLYRFMELSFVQHWRVAIEVHSCWEMGARGLWPASRAVVIVCSACKLPNHP